MKINNIKINNIKIENLATQSKSILEEESKEEKSTKMEEKEISINIKKNFLQIIGFLANFTSILLFVYGMIYALGNYLYKIKNATYFSLPTDFFSMNFTEYFYILCSLLAIGSFFIYFINKNLNNKFEFISLFIELIILEIIFFILVLSLWTWKIRNYLNGIKLYEYFPRKVEWGIVILGIASIILVHYLFYKKDKWLFSGIVYLFLAFLLLWGKHDLYLEVFLKKPKSQERYFVIGNYEGMYAIAIGEEKEGCIIFSNKVDIVKLEEIKKFSTHFYRTRLYANKNI